MNLALISTVLLSSILSLYAAEDILNFKNNDTLHGTFLGFSEEGKLVWKNDQADTPITFATNELRRVIFNKGQLTKPFSHGNTITLINGDILPCEILSLDEKKISIRTDYAGNLEIARDQVYSCDVQPHGQKVIYQGPFIEENWKVVDFKEKEDKKEKVWEYASFGWLNDGSAGAIINQKTELPDAFRMTFKSDMARYSNVCLVFHADFTVPNKKDEEGKKNIHSYTKNITDNFGSCLLLRITSGSTNLSQYYFDKDGSPVVTKVPTTLGSASARYSGEDNSEIQIEIRVDRNKKVISSYTDGSLIAQWNLADIGYEAKGTKFGFANLYNSSNRVSRISNIIVSPWNGIRDSALSLQNEQRDIVLLNNGTDRFSGEILSLQENIVSLKGPYAEMEIPTDQIKSLNFATETLAKAEESQSGSIAFRFYGTGRLTGNSVSGNEKSIELNHLILGKISLKYDFLSSIDYTPDTAIIDRWNLQLQ